jgi:pimeloyl-ACP methyl ester carboxylesterase
MTSATEAVERARLYLDSEDAAEGQALLEELGGYEGDFAAIVERLKPVLPDKVEKGLILNRHFRVPGLCKKHPDDLMSLYVPEDYNAEQARGFVLFLHGGGQAVARDAGSKVFDEGYGISDLLMESGFVVCAPCAPYHEQSFNGWNVPDTDAYVMDVIEEVAHSYNIDPDRVFLAGTSMGGIGANHLAHRMPDRFAGVLSAASSWDIAFWPCLKGTSIWIMHGVNDAVMFRRRHGTDIGFAHLMKERLEQAGVSTFYREHCGGHSMRDGRRIVREWLRWAETQKRDAFYPHVVAPSRRGLSPWLEWKRYTRPLVSFQNHLDFHDLAESPHMRWVTVDGIGEESIRYDLASVSACRDDCEDEWNDFAVTLGHKHIRAGLVEACVCEGSVIEVTPQNVTGFTLWLHPDMVDLKQVRVIAKGRERFSGEVKPDLGTLLASYRRRRDWGLLYPAKVTIEGDRSWETSDQIELK